MSESCDVLVAGAGLAGLQCARLLTDAGLAVEVWEAADDVGGRIRTDEVDGFRVDRGFQVLNPAYPAVRRWVDADALGLQPFGAGIGVRRERGRALLAHPLRDSRRLPATLRSGLITPRAAVALARWGGAALRDPEERDHTLDVTVAAALDAAKVRGEMRRVVERFLAGVLLEDDMSTSQDFALMLVRSFADGVSGVPAEGMQALPRQLAGLLRTPVRTGHRVTGVAADGLRTRVHADGASIRADRVVLATDPWSLGDLDGLGWPGDAPPPEPKGVLTHWWATDEAPTDLPMLYVDARAHPTGPLVNTAVMTLAAPSYAPPGRHLVETSALLGRGRPMPTEEEVRRHAGDVYGVDAGRWELVARHEVPRALPAQPPPLEPRRSLEVWPRLWVCGDHRDTGSIQGALVSGTRAAEAVLESGRR